MKNTNYFLHIPSIDKDPKIMLMVSEWGLEFYGIFWTIIEHLRTQPEHKSHLSMVRVLADRYNSSTEKYLSVIKSFGLFNIQDDGHFHSKYLNFNIK